MGGYKKPHSRKFPKDPHTCRMPIQDNCVQFKEYSCDLCNIIFQNKIEWQKHKDKQVCIDVPPGGNECESEMCAEKKVHCIPEELTYKIGKRICQTKAEYEKYKEDEKLIRPSKGAATRRKTKFFKSLTMGTGDTSDSDKQHKLPVELYNKMAETQKVITTIPNPKYGQTTSSFYKMAEDILGRDSNLDWIQVGVKVPYREQRVPIVEVWEGGIYFIEYRGEKIRLQYKYALYNNLTKDEVEDVIKRFTRKHTKKTTISTEGTNPNYYYKSQLPFPPPKQVEEIPGPEIPPRPPRTLTMKFKKENITNCNEKPRYVNVPGCILKVGEKVKYDGKEYPIIKVDCENNTYFIQIDPNGEKIRLSESICPTDIENKVYEFDSKLLPRKGYEYYDINGMTPPHGWKLPGNKTVSPYVVDSTSYQSKAALHKRLDEIGKIPPYT